MSDNKSIQECPVAVKCPYIAQYSSSSTQEGASGCPVANKGCTYYEEHKDDKDMKEMLLKDMQKGCPMAGKCPFFDKLKDKKAALDSLNWETSTCPLADKCPYYAKLKEQPEKLLECPLIAACPEFQKNSSKDWAQAVEKCPHFSKKE